jgi:hypothetical protein
MKGGLTWTRLRSPSNRQISNVKFGIFEARNHRQPECLTISHSSVIFYLRNPQNNSVSHLNSMTLRSVLKKHFKIVHCTPEALRVYYRVLYQARNLFLSPSRLLTTQRLIAPRY